MLFFCIFLISIQLKLVWSRGYALTSNQSYTPLDICIFYQDLNAALMYTCYSGQLYTLFYSGTISCDNSAFLLFNQTTTEPYDCGESGNYDDYIEYTQYDIDIMGSYQCDNINDIPNNTPRLTNKCVYEPAYKLYKIDACTSTIWSTFRYSDSKCQNTLYRNQIIDECNQPVQLQSIQLKITTCTTPINTIENQFGYIQLDKNSVLRPLDECIISSSIYSHIYTCNNNKPYWYYWNSNNNKCNSDLSTADGNFPITPFFFSCSNNKHDIARLNVYENDINNNCVEQNITTNHSSFPNIVNQCFNFFDENNTLVSIEWKCDDKSLWNIHYSEPNCNNQSLHWIDSNYTEECSIAINMTERYKIECIPAPIPTQSPTKAPIITPDPTTEPTRMQTPSPTNHNERIFYVTASGEDRFDCDINGQNCGTLRYASSRANYIAGSSLYNVSRIEIIVQGQNPTAIRKYINNTGANPCVPHKFLPIGTDLTDVIITFDPQHIASMQDWYNISLCEQNTNTGIEEGFFWQSDEGIFKVIANNLIIDNYVFNGDALRPYYIAYLDTFNCYNCTFSNIIIHTSHYENFNAGLKSKRAALISAGNAIFRNCKFINITYDSPINDYSEFSFIEINSQYEFNQPQNYGFSFIMNGNTEIENLNGLNSFIYLNLVAFTGYLNAQIDNVKFEQVSVVDTVIRLEFDAVAPDFHHISITHCAFYNMNMGSVLKSSSINLGKAIISIENVNISTIQTIEGYLKNKQILGKEIDDYYSLLVFDSDRDIININQVHIEYLYGHTIYWHCNDNQGSSSYAAYLWYSLENFLYGVNVDYLVLIYECNHPIQFIDNVAILNINDLSATNDITDTIINEYRSFIISEIRSQPYKSNADIYIDFTFNYSTDGDYGFIYNHDKGQVDIDGLYVYGSGIHETVILSPDGKLSINNMMAIPETFCANNDIPCEFDPDALQMNYWIRYNAADSVCFGQEIRVSNSYLFGANVQSLLIGGGEAYLHNITIQMSTTAIVASADISYLEILSSQFIDIGTWYSSAIRRFYAYNPIYIPMVLKSDIILIQDSIFSYISPYQFELFDATGFFQGVSLDLTLDRQSISLINNVFEINDENVLYPYPSG
eukprot:346509_1